MMSLKLYTVKGQALRDSAALAEYGAARAVGGVRVGPAHLFFRAGLRVYAAGWGEITRCYRQVMRVPLKMCCGSGSLDVESLIVMGEAGELAKIQLPGSRAARALMDMIAEAAPQVSRTPPARQDAPEVRA